MDNVGFKSDEVKKSYLGIEWRQRGLPQRRFEEDAHSEETSSHFIQPYTYIIISGYSGIARRAVGAIGPGGSTPPGLGLLAHRRRSSSMVSIM